MRRAAAAGGTGALFVDFDNDSDQDLIVGHVGWVEKDGTLGGNTLQLYINDGDGRFTEQSAAYGLDLRLDAYSLTAFDYDVDGWIDIYVSCYGRIEAEHNNSWIEATNGSPNALLRNVGAKRFEDVAEAAGVRGSRWSYAAAAADIDYNGTIDLYVANDYGSNRLYKNNGNGTFTDIAEERVVTDVGNGMGVSFGDIDNDGLLDVYVSNMSSSAGNRILSRLAPEEAPVRTAGGSATGPPEGSISRAEATSTERTLLKLAAGNTIFRQVGDGGFEMVPSSNGGVGASWAWSCALLDIDLDATQDIYVANGFISGDSLKDT